MNIQRFIGILITMTILLTSCSQKVSQIDYDKKTYEYDQLKIRYDLLRNEVDGGITTTTSAPPKTTTVPPQNHHTDYEQLKQNYEKLLKEHASLQVAYDDMQIKEDEAKATKSVPPGTVSKTAFNELKEEKAALEKRYVILENRYNTLKELSKTSNTSSIASAEIVEPTEINPDLNIGKGELEESSIDLGTTIVQSASFNGLFFDFDTYERTQDYLVLEVAIKNNSQNSLKTFWNAEKIQIIDTYGNTYTTDYFRVGVDYANETNNTLAKRIKDENTVFARFAFEELPDDFKQIQSLKFIVIIDGEERPIEFTQIDISQIEVD